MATWLYLDLEDEREVFAEQIVGAANTPLSFTDGGYLELEDDDLAEELALRKRHIHVAANHPDADSSEASTSDEGADGDADEAFDPFEFVDRTPMDDIIEDLQSGEYDDRLDAIEDAADRQGVLNTIDERRES